MKELWAQWDGEAFKPMKQYQKACDEHLVIGEKYHFEPQEARSARSHNHQFAELGEIWANLPEGMETRWLNQEQMRKHALIMTGYCSQQIINSGSQAEAMRWAQVIRAREPYSIVIVRDNNVVILEAESQKKSGIGAMGAARFQESKTAVLDYLHAEIAKHYQERAA